LTLTAEGAAPVAYDPLLFGFAIGDTRSIDVDEMTRPVTVIGPPPGTRNLALGKPAMQSSTDFGGGAARAVDGNTDGNFWGNSVTHTKLEAQPWWEVDLGAVVDIGKVVLHNRTDCCGDRLSNFEVLLSNDNHSWWRAAAMAGTAATRSELLLDASARFVRVQLRGTNYLSLAEVEVLLPAIPRDQGAPPAIYRMYNGSTADHLLTRSYEEALAAISTYGYAYEGILGRFAGDGAPGAVPLYRLLSTRYGVDHFYTASAAEKDAAVTQYGYVYEQVAGYLYPSSQPGTCPLYRTLTGAHHFYTPSWTEVSWVLSHGGQYEGLTGYVHPAGSTCPN